TTAMTGALAALKPMQFDPRQKTQIMAGVGSYKNNQAIAVGMAHYFNENFMMNAGLSAGTGYKNNYVANAGFTLKLGSKDDRKDYTERYEAGPTQANYQMQLEIEQLKREIKALKNK
nr:YadA C-terminal domain-containing protein [Fusobacterium sp.]